MNCKEVYRDFSDYLDGKLSEERRSELESHITNCARCNAYHRTLADGVREYRSLPQIKLPDDFYGRLEHSIYDIEENERLERSRPWLRSLTGTLSPVLSAGIAFAGFIYLFSTHTPDRQTTLQSAAVQSSFTSTAEAGRSSAGRDEAFELARFLEDFVDDYIGDRLTPFRSSIGNVPVSVEDPAFATFVSEDPSFSPGNRHTSPATPLIETSMGFAAIPARMERPLSRLTKSEDGLLVVDVEFMSKAFVAGLRKGDVIISLDEQPIKQARSMVRQVLDDQQKARGMRVVRSGKVVNLRID